MIFFYEFVFIALTIVAVLVGEIWSRLAAFLFLLLWFGISALGYASFEARLATETLTDDDRRWFTDARDGMRHLRLLFGLAALAALAWRVIAG
ncbi:MAG: hypothetical protein JOZ81_17955 [Chloroflexi bacterium]|nr:hypothetical protein [Chloroflexota bacterium]MBV9543397.1 hypothetical protein [Chloroflexota bacterium]